MFKKILSLVLITIVAISSVGCISGADVISDDSQLVKECAVQWIVNNHLTSYSFEEFNERYDYDIHFAGSDRVGSWTVEFNPHANDDLGYGVLISQNNDLFHVVDCSIYC